MFSFKWSSSYESGVPMLDLQHKTFISQLVKFNAGCEAGGEAQRLVETLSFLKSYGEEHLFLEESLMDVVGYGHAVSHKALHSEFKGKIEALIGSFDFYDKPSSNTILSSNYLMTDWFLKHIRSEDAALCREILEKMREDAGVRRHVDSMIARYDASCGRLKRS